MMRPPYTAVVALLLVTSCAERRTPECNDSANRLIDLCNYSEDDAKSYVAECNMWTINNDNDLRVAAVDTADCILEAADCEDVQVCFGAEPKDPNDEDGDGVGKAKDCDDQDPNVYPGAPELCDGVDNDCNGVADADVGGEVDTDGDGALSCEDCADDDAARYPGAAEECDGLDNDCSGGLDPEEVDQDADGSPACEDCDDTDPAVSPHHEEIPDDGIDQNCSGSDYTTCYFDSDFDGYGGIISEVVPYADCEDSFPWEAASDDCDDSDPNVNPGAYEDCSDGIDNDCNGHVDADDPVCP